MTQIFEFRIPWISIPKPRFLSHFSQNELWVLPTKLIFVPIFLPPQSYHIAQISIYTNMDIFQYIFNMVIKQSWGCQMMWLCHFPGSKRMWILNLSLAIKSTRQGLALCPYQNLLWFNMPFIIYSNQSTEFLNHIKISKLNLSPTFYPWCHCIPTLRMTNCHSW